MAQSDVPTKTLPDPHHFIRLTPNVPLPTVPKTSKHPCVAYLDKIKKRLAESQITFDDDDTNYYKELIIQNNTEYTMLRALRAKQRSKEDKEIQSVMKLFNKIFK